jgi:hypothetical protein
MKEEIRKRRTLLIPAKRERVAFPLPVRERIKVRVHIQRAIVFARDLRFCFHISLRTVSSTYDQNRSGILNRALKEARCKKTLTLRQAQGRLLILSLTGRGEEGSGILRFALNDTGTGRGEELQATLCRGLLTRRGAAAAS